MIDTEVEIYGKRYVLRGMDSAAIKTVAGFLDKRMREMFGPEPKPLDPARTLSLAINLAEEIHNLQLEQGRNEQELSQKLEQLIKKIELLEKSAEI